MDFRDVLRQRRSVKHYDPAHTMSDEELKDLFTLATLTPSSFNSQNWHFTAVRDQETKAAMCAASWNQAQVKDAATVVVISGRLDLSEGMDRYLRDMPAEGREGFEGMIRGFYDKNPQLQRDEACRSVGLAGMTIMLAAKDMGLDSCPMIGFDPTKIAGILGLPEGLPPLMLVTIGKALKPAHPRMGFFDLQESVSLDKYGSNGLRGEVDPS